MRRPSQQTMVIGQPLVAASLQLFGGGMVILCLCVGMNAFLPGFVACCIVGEATRAAEAVKAYKRWMAICDEVDGPDRPRRPTFRTYLGLAVGSVTAILLFGELAEPGNAVVALDWVFGLAGVAGIARLVLRVRKRARRPARATTVTVVATCAMPPVPLAKAFALLPEHCQRILVRPQP